MDELALSILDLATNSQMAGADKIEIDISVSAPLDRIEISVADNGKGMTQEEVVRATDPFFTTRTTRRVGMGLALFGILCEQCEGSLKIESGFGEGQSGTTVFARLRLGSVNRPPIGDLGSTMIALISGNTDARYILRYRNKGEFVFDTDEVLRAVGGGAYENDTLIYLSKMINENIENINGGFLTI